MSTSITMSPRGLFTNYNLLSQVEAGSLVSANNLVLDEMGTIKPRRGIKYYSSMFTNLNHRARQLLEYKGRILRHVENKLAFDDGNGLFTDFNGTYTDPTPNTRLKGVEYKGNFYFTSNSGVKKISAKSPAEIQATSIQNTGAPLSAGMKTSLLADANGFIQASQHVSYRVTWGYIDNNNLLIEGIPSNTVFAVNNTTFNGFSVDCRIYIPVTATTNYFFRLYRSETRSTTETLSSEFSLVFQGYPDASDLLAGYVDYTDSLPEDFRTAGIPLYTNPYSGEGESNINYAPPFATDVALYQNHLFYANTRLRHIKNLTLQSIDNFQSGITDFVVSDGISTRTYLFQGQPEISTVACQPLSFFNNGDYFLLNSARNERRYYVYFKTSPIVGVPVNPDIIGRTGIEVDIQSSTTALDVANTLAATLNALNDFEATVLAQIVTITNTECGESDAVADSIFQPTNLVYTTFQQGLGEDFATNKVLLQSTVINSKLEALDATARSLVDVINNDILSVVDAMYLGNGKIALLSRSFDDVPFYTNSTDVAVKTSWFPNLSATNNPSDASKTVNGLYFSKQDQPESVPLLNTILVGSSDEPILRIVPLRESLFIFKTDGLYRLSGYDKNSFTVNLFDSTAILKAPDSVAVLRNQVYFYGTQGVSRVSEGGSDKLSDPIDDKIIQLITTCGQLDKLTFGVAYETDESYMLWTALKANDTIAQVAYRYNLHTNSWTEWKISKTCAVLNTNEDKLYFGSGAAATLEVERKSFDRFDYADREINITLPTSSMFENIIKPSGASQIEAGDVIYQLQGVTIYQFNLVLTMLKEDPSFPSIVYDDFIASAGDDINTKIASLVGYLNTIDTSTFTDSFGNTSYVFTSSSDVTVAQQEWFAVVGRINQSAFFFRSNYPVYDRFTPVEARVVRRDISNNDVYLDIQYPFVSGDMVLYKAINTSLEFVPQTAGDVSSLKQFQAGQIMFKNRSITSAQVGFSSDLSTDLEYVTFNPNSAGIWGYFPWGTGCVWGGEGDKAPLRTYVPARKQRCRFIGLAFKHAAALETYSLYGIALSYVSTSDRAYK